MICALYRVFYISMPLKHVFSSAGNVLTKLNLAPSQNENLFAAFCARQIPRGLDFQNILYVKLSQAFKNVVIFFDVKKEPSVTFMSFFQN